MYSLFLKKLGIKKFTANIPYFLIINLSRTVGFVTLCYLFNKAIKRDRIGNLFHANRGSQNVSSKNISKNVYKFER